MLLMSKDVVLAEVDFDKMLFNVFCPELMPFSLRGQGVSILSIHEWVLQRTISLSRSNAKAVINSLGLDPTDRLSLCYACKGLSLTDCYWLKSESDTKSNWDTVSLYRNSLSNSVAHVALTGEYITIQGRVHTPELTSGGSFAKCWRRGKDGIYLYKAGSSGGKEPMIEVFCSELLDTLGVNHVKYTLVKSGLQRVSRCRNITDENVSICEMSYFANYCKRNGINLSKYLSTQEDYFKMLIVDYLIFNSDRHLNNWGVYFSANTGKCLGLHPLLDHNIALNPNADFNSKVIHGKTLEDCAKYAKRFTYLDVSELKRWVKRSSTKRKLKDIDRSGKYYSALVARIKKYEQF